MSSKNTYFLIGAMSGTSLDGIDLCYAQYIFENGQWNFNILASKTYAYIASLKTRIACATDASALEITRLDRDLGDYTGEQINRFIAEFNISKSQVDAIASHGHTIFHLPQERLTLQIGCGTSISLKTGIKCINNFRLKDVRNGGQGAPLVPIGDRLLFDLVETAFLNIGGFANLSFKKGDKQIGFDICPVNFVLNQYAEKLGFTYDDKGHIASKGILDSKLLNSLNSLKRYTNSEKDSLGSEWVEEFVTPLLHREPNNATILATYTHHAAQQIILALEKEEINKVLITGGGAYNDYLIQLIKSKYRGTVEIPEPTVIEFKEALIFGFLGVLFLRNEVNCLAEITGAPVDVVGGILHTL